MHYNKLVTIENRRHFTQECMQFIGCTKFLIIHRWQHCWTNYRMSDHVVVDSLNVADMSLWLK